jgi:hypothetical protein
VIIHHKGGDPAFFRVQRKQRGNGEVSVIALARKVGFSPPVDVTEFLNHFAINQYYLPSTALNSCIGDFNYDADVDADDVTMFLEDFGRGQYFNPCPACLVGDWCVYP